MPCVVSPCGQNMGVTLVLKDGPVTGFRVHDGNHKVCLQILGFQWDCRQEAVPWIKDALV
jgi:hypothetical protein